MAGITIMINPRLTKGGCNPPYGFFSGRSTTLKQVAKGTKVISFKSFAVIFMKIKIGGNTLPGVG